MENDGKLQQIRLLKDGKLTVVEQNTNKYRLPLFYALPQELVSKAKTYENFPRCPYDLIWTDKYDAQINDDSFMQLIMDCYAWAFWQCVEVPDGKGGHRRLIENFNHYSGDFPIWILCYRALSYIQQKFEAFGFSFQALGSLRKNIEVPWQSYEKFFSLIATVTPEIIREQNWQPIIDDAWENRTMEDFSSFASRAKTDFFRAWHHSRIKVGVMESLDSDEKAQEDAALSRESFEDENINKLRIADFVQTLSPRDQQIWNLKAQHYTDQEIAKEVGYSTHSAVVKRIQHIAKCYDQYVQAEYEEYLNGFASLSEKS